MAARACEGRQRQRNTSIDTIISRRVDNAEILISIRPVFNHPAISVQVAVGFHDAGTLSRLRHPSRSLYVACKYDDRCVGVVLFDINDQMKLTRKSDALSIALLNASLKLVG